MKIKKTALILFILLLLISLAATPLWALSSETSAQTTGEAFEELTAPPFSDELGTAGDHGENETRSNDEIVSATYLEDGVYAFRNVGNGNFWMDVRANNYTSSTNMQQYYTTTLPTDSFERSLLFKITRNETTNRYVIRLMLNNRLTFDFSGNNVMTKVIPAKDSEVAAVDTFAITRSGSGYTIRPNDSSYLVSANSSQASGSAGAPDSNLVRKTPTAAGNCGIWEIHRYTGTSRSGVSVSMSPTIPDGLTVGDHTLVSFATWSTVADANTPHLEVSSAYSSRASVTLQSTSSDFLTKYQVKAEKAGKFELTYRIKNASGGNAYSSYQMYMAIPDIDVESFYIQNGATGRYMDVEGPSTAEGAYIQQWDFSTAPQKQWTVTPVGGGYYSIKSNYSQRYVGVDSQNTANIRQYSALNDYTKWYFKETNSGRYAIHCKMWSVTGVLAGQSDTSGNGSDLTTSVYTNDSSYRDEWRLDPVAYKFAFVGIPDEGHDHSSVLYTIKSDLLDFDTDESEFDIQIYDTILPSNQAYKYLKKANVFTSRSHGDRVLDNDTVLSTYILLNHPTSYANKSAIYSHDILGLVPQDSIFIPSQADFSNLDLAIFVGCYTGEGGSGAYNLPTKAVECGARVAIGFEGSIGCNSANDWTDFFYNKLLEGKTVQEAWDYANRNSGLISVLCGDGSYQLP